MKSSRTALYRHFDEAGRLLYVGISLNSINRTKQHEAGARWFEQIARIEIEWFCERAQALAAEAIAIAKESPLFNIARPSTSGRQARVSPFPSETNEVKVRGQPLHPVLWAGKQWAVTDYGIECRDGTYHIEAGRLFENERCGHSHTWIDHMGEKVWVDAHDFERAFWVAAWIHCGRQMPKRLHQRA